MLTRPTQALRSPPAASQRPVLEPRLCIHHPELGITGHHRGFTHVHPSGLPLACDSRMERSSLGVYSELHTPPLPATHVGAGTDIEHLSGITPPASTGPPANASTHRVDLRVARLPSHHLCSSRCGTSSQLCCLSVRSSTRPTPRAAIVAGSPIGWCSRTSSRPSSTARATSTSPPSSARPAPFADV